MLELSWRDFVISVSVCVIGWVIVATTKSKREMRSQANKFLRLAKQRAIGGIPAGAGALPLSNYFPLAPALNNTLTQEHL